jgi:hypothetical protein
LEGFEIVMDFNKIETILDTIEYLLHIVAGSILLYIMYGFVKFMDAWSKLDVWSKL